MNDRNSFLSQLNKLRNLDEYLATKPTDVKNINGMVNICTGINSSIIQDDIAMTCKNGIVTIVKNGNSQQYRGQQIALIYGHPYIDKYFVKENDERLIIENKIEFPHPGPRKFI